MNSIPTGKITPTDKTNWEKVNATSDDDITYDDDNPRTSPSDWEGAVMRKNGEVIGTVRTRGKQKKPTKITTTLRLSPEVMNYFKSTGDGWQTRVDEALREYVSKHPV